MVWLEAKAFWNSIISFHAAAYNHMQIQTADIVVAKPRTVINARMQSRFTVYNNNAPLPDIRPFSCIIYIGQINMKH